jgi:hypothetical protein
MKPQRSPLFATRGATTLGFGASVGAELHAATITVDRAMAANRIDLNMSNIHPDVQMWYFNSNTSSFYFVALAFIRI